MQVPDANEILGDTSEEDSGNGAQDNDESYALERSPEDISQS